MNSLVFFLSYQLSNFLWKPDLLFHRPSRVTRSYCGYNWQVANYLKTTHKEFAFTVQEGLDALSDVIYHTETYDVTTIRASTPMFLLSRKVKAMGVKMVLSGEGADEIFGGYLYFHNAPSLKEFHYETVSRVKNLHTSDCLRVLF